jgi:hypothetical protein
LACEIDTTNISTSLESSFEIYPNPVNDRLFIKTEAIVDEVEILDVFGRQMTTAKNQIPTVIDVTKLNSGVYFIRMNTNKGEIIKRFVKE